VVQAVEQSKRFRVGSRRPGAGDDAAERVEAAPAGPAADRRLHFLDSVRAVSALYVVAHHLYLAVYPGYPVNTGPAVMAPLMYGQFGVAVFIVVSGFSLALAPVKRDWQLTGGFKRFIRRRAWRIIPPYWAALFLSVAIVGLVVNQRADVVLSVRGVLTHLFLVQDVVEGPTPNGAFWSIAVEWQLYFVFPLFLLVRRRFGAVVLCASIVAVVSAIELAAPHSAVADKLTHLSPQFAALFVFGIVAASVTVRAPGKGIRWWGWLAVLAAVVLVGLCLAMGVEGSISHLYWLDLVIGVSVATGIAALAARPGGRVRQALEVRPLTGIGQFSYSLYLIHAPLLLVAWLFVVQPLGLTQIVSYAVMFFGVLPFIMLASYGFYRGVERPFVRHRSLGALLGRSASQPTRVDDLARTPSAN
jgi:peptidoglycan/LPS O-acetylase OafA/YrhL